MESMIDKKGKTMDYIEEKMFRRACLDHFNYITKQLMRDSCVKSFPEHGLDVVYFEDLSKALIITRDEEEWVIANGPYDAVDRYLCLLEYKNTKSLKK